MILLFILLGLLEGCTHSSAIKPTSPVLTKVNNSTKSDKPEVTPTVSSRHWSSKFRIWLIYFLELLRTLFGLKNDLMEKFLGLFDKTHSVSLTFHLT
ncbi:unnamed protein product [Schistosoma rodhaini]|uniref:Uncharacterized protein n=1 Tax=Schistosoma rodhaini TaxID=6188 RepID=A0AA85GAY3_9TREM|nr:unnamed protein product [Schistosoma rodhaini]